MYRILILISALVSLSFSSFSYADCAANDAPCLARLATDIAESNSNAALLGVIVVGAASYGIYKLVTANDTPEEAEFRAEEFSKGHGIRLNDIHSPFRLSVIKPLLGDQIEQSHYMNQSQSAAQVGIINLEYEW